LNVTREFDRRNNSDFPSDELSACMQLKRVNSLSAGAAGCEQLSLSSAHTRLVRKIPAGCGDCRIEFPVHSNNRFDIRKLMPHESRNMKMHHLRIVWMMLMMQMYSDTWRREDKSTADDFFTRFTDESLNKRAVSEHRPVKSVC
jgi:hypothetical protein